MFRLLFSTTFFALLSISMNAQTGNITFKASGVQTNLGGELSAGIFKEPNFPTVGEQFRGKDAKVTSSTMEITLKDVPVGTYGADVFHDANTNNELETNFVGFPMESIGFANDAKIRFGPPSFEDASITVVAGKTIIVPIKLK
ncbi:MAG: DUF2141 domain-containing protein [Mameliella sp.]|nr:DUF2141 domain-containing protein [Phaeodactylibacter sp.]